MLLMNLKKRDHSLLIWMNWCMHGPFGQFSAPVHLLNCKCSLFSSEVSTLSCLLLWSVDVFLSHWVSPEQSPETAGKQPVNFITVLLTLLCENRAGAGAWNGRNKEWSSRGRHAWGMVLPHPYAPVYVVLPVVSRILRANVLWQL